MDASGCQRDGTVIVLAMHGVPPSDFPATELHEIMSLHAHPDGGDAAERLAMLEGRLRAWPRCPENDPYWAGSGGHSERDIPAAVARAQERHPEVEIRYVRPVSPTVVARWLAALLRLWSRVPA